MARRQGIRHRVATIAAVVLLAGAVAGCSKTEVPGGLRGMAPSVSGNAGDGVCGLLAEEELEVALNAPLQTEGGSRFARSQPPREAGAGRADERPSGGPLGAPRPIVPGMQMCGRASQVVDDNGDGTPSRVAWGVLSESDKDSQDRESGLSEPARDAENGGDEAAGEERNTETSSDEEEAARSLEDVFRRYREWHASYVERVGLDGHEALWDEELGTLVVLADAKLVGVSVKVVDPPGTDDAVALYTQEQARELASRILRRL